MIVIIPLWQDVANGAVDALFVTSTLATLLICSRGETKFFRTPFGIPIAWIYGLQSHSKHFSIIIEINIQA